MFRYGKALSPSRAHGPGLKGRCSRIYLRSCVNNHPHAGGMNTTFAKRVSLFGVCAIPLIFAPGVFLDPFNIPKLTALGLLLGLGLSAIGTRLILRSGNGTNAPRTGLVVPAALFIGPVLISWLLSPTPRETLIGRYQNLQGLLPSLAIVGFALLLVFVGAKAKSIIQCLALSGTLVAAYGFCQSMGFDPLRLVYEGSHSVAPTSTLGNTNFSGGFLAIVLPLSIILWKGGSLRRYAGMAATALIGVTLILTFSQGAWAAAVGGLIATAVLANQKNHVFKKAAFAAVLMIAALLVSSVGLLFVGIRIPTAGGGSDDRAVLWSSAVRMAADRPIAGWGPDAYSLRASAYLQLSDFLEYPYRAPEDPHSVPLATAVGTGVIGVAGLLGLLIWIVQRFARAEQEGLVIPALAGGLGAYWLQALVSIDQVPLRFALWSLLAALAAITERQRAQSPRIATGREGRAVGVMALLLSLPILGGSILLAAADVKAEQAVNPAGPGGLERGQQLLRESLAIREETEYRKLLVRWVAADALGDEATNVLPEMSSAFGPLEESVDFAPALLYGRLLHYIAPEDPDVLSKGIESLERAARLSPENPLVQIELADAYVTGGQPDPAIRLLESLASRAPLVGDIYAEYWPVITAAHLRAGDAASASEAASLAERKHPEACGTSTAKELVRTQAQGYVPEPSTLLTLRIQCDAEYYNLFVHRLPAPQQHLYI